MNTYIDIVGACNSSCPSCPMGNSENVNFIDFQRRTIMGLPVESEKLGRTGEVSAQNFDEAQYLQMNQDVKNAISTGAFTSGYQHYVLFGRLEGRLGAGYLTVV